jgi:hypothetical protein
LADSNGGANFAGAGGNQRKPINSYGNNNGKSQGRFGFQDFRSNQQTVMYQSQPSGYREAPVDKPYVQPATANYGNYNNFNSGGSGDRRNYGRTQPSYQTNVPPYQQQNSGYPPYSAHQAGQPNPMPSAVSHAVMGHNGHLAHPPVYPNMNTPPSPAVPTMNPQAYMGTATGYYDPSSGTYVPGASANSQIEMMVNQFQGMSMHQQPAQPHWMVPPPAPSGMPMQMHAMEMDRRRMPIPNNMHQPPVFNAMPPVPNRDQYMMNMHVPSQGVRNQQMYPHHAGGMHAPPMGMPSPRPYDQRQAYSRPQSRAYYPNPPGGYPPSQSHSSYVDTTDGEQDDVQKGRSSMAYNGPDGENGVDVPSDQGAEQEVRD